MAVVLIVLAVILTVVAAGIGGFAALTRRRLRQLAAMSFEDMLQYTTRNRKDALIAVGTLQNGAASHSFYGENAKPLAGGGHVYEIGSITKTFTAALLCQAIEEGRLRLDDTIDQHLKLPQGGRYPTLRQLVTHTSGYKSYYLEPQMLANKCRGRNDFYGVSETRLVRRLGRIRLKEGAYGFRYSNFGMGVVGAVLSAVYGEAFAARMNAFAAGELGLVDTKISDGTGDLGRYWQWAPNDAYMPAGALTSTIEDMLRYAQMQLDGAPKCLGDTHRPLARIRRNFAAYAKMNIHLDAIGAAWIIDEKNDLLWHNGGTRWHNSYIGIAPATNTAVVVLANLPPGYRIPATAIGARRLLDLGTG